MLRIIMFSLFVMLFSCKNEETGDSHLYFKETLLDTLLYTTDIDRINSSSSVIEKPLNTEILILSAKYYEEGSSSMSFLCVYYHTPFREKKGTLSIIKAAKNKCLEIRDQKANLFLENVTDLIVQKDGFRVIFSYVANEKFYKQVIELVNQKESFVHEKYKAQTKKELYRNLSILKINTDTFDSKNSNLGRISDQFSDGSAINCHQVNKDCNDVVENICSMCKYGYYEVVDFKCPQGGSKYCGINRCGEKNEPACIRGIEKYEEGTEGICNPELTPVINADGVWVCQ